MPAESGTFSLTVQLFAAARARVAKASVAVQLRAPATVASLIQAVSEQVPALATLMPQLRVAVDQTFVAAESPVTAKSEVALIPPVAGGVPSGCWPWSNRPLSLDEVVRAVSTPGHGGVVTFSGAVRDATKGRKVVRLEYEAYGGRAEKQLSRIADEVEAKTPGARVAVVHRVGLLVPGELAVVIAVSTPHRAEAFAGCQHVIERLKQDVPIWKREVFEDGESWVGVGP